jgi:hypothetical protein
MNRRIKAILLVGSLAVATAFATVLVLTEALAKVIDPAHSCETGFSRLISCTYHWTSTRSYQSTPIFTTPSNATGTTAPAARETSEPIYVDATSWGIVDCPRNDIARRLLCAVPSDAAPVEAADDDFVTGLPRPKPWLLTTAKDSPFIKAFHLETPLQLASVLRFYRLALNSRGWSENAGAVVEPGAAVIAFTTTGGPALLRLTRQDNRTIVDLSLRKQAAADPGFLPMPGRVKLLLGNATDEEAVIIVNGQAVELAAGAGRALTDDLKTAREAAGRKEINLLPGKYNVTFRVASGAIQNRQFELVADETWGLLAGPAAEPIPVRLY